VTAGAVTADTAATPARRQHRPRGWLSKTVQILGELLITFGIIVFLFIFYEVKVTDWIAAGTQHKLANKLEQQWQAPVPGAKTIPKKSGTTTKPAAVDPPLTVTEGEGFAVMTIPRFGEGFHWIVVEGVNTGDLQKGPGHYPGTALPGVTGNMVVSGHRTTYGHPFNQLDELNNGDSINIQVRSKTYSYKVIRKEIVDPSDTAVILPVPGKFGVKPTQKLLTLTTCNPKYSAAQRLIVTAELSGSAT
jgi:sortase A